MSEFNLTSGEVSESLIKDLKKAIDSKKYEFTDSGMVLFGNDINVQVGGIFDSWVDRHELVSKNLGTAEEQYARELVFNHFLQDKDNYESIMADSSHNIIPDYGINAILDILFYSTSKISTWYQGPFKSNWTPSSSARSNWAGASSGPLATELAAADYTAGVRQAATFGTASASKSISTSAASVFTLASGTSGISLYGSTLNSVNTVAYNSTDAVLIAATRFSTAKTGLGAGDIINITYSIAGSST